MAPKRRGDAAAAGSTAPAAGAAAAAAAAAITIGGSSGAVAYNAPGGAGGEYAQEYAVVWRALPATPEWSAASADSSARVVVVVAPEPRGLLEPVVTTASEMARVTREVLDRIGDELAEHEAAASVDVEVVSFPFMAEAPDPHERSAPTPHVPLAGLLRGVVAEQRRLRTGVAVRHICVSAAGAGGAAVDDALNARLPPASEEPEVMVHGGEVLAPRLERRARSRRHMPQLDGADDGMRMATCLVVVDSPGDITPGGAGATAIAFHTSRPSCESVVVWAPAMPSPGSSPAKAIDDVLAAAAARGIQVTFSAVDMRDDTQIARACQALWVAATSVERAVDTVVCIRASAGDASGDVFGSDTAMALTETELVQTYAQAVGLMNALDALAPAAFFTISPFTAVEYSMASSLCLASRALDDAVSMVISQRHGTRVVSVGIALPAFADFSAPTATELNPVLLASMAGNEGANALQTIIRLSGGVSISIVAASLGLVSAAAATAAAYLLPRAAAYAHAPMLPPQSVSPTSDDIQRRVGAAAATILARGPESPPLEYSKPSEPEPPTTAREVVFSALVQFLPQALHPGELEGADAPSMWSMVGWCKLKPML